MSLDIKKTQLQETGACSIAGLSIADLMQIVTDLGLDPNTTIVFKDDLIIRPKRAGGQ